MNIPSWALILISSIWGALSQLLTTLGVPSIVVDALTTVLQHFGLLGGKSISKEELMARAEKLQNHCKGV